MNLWLFEVASLSKITIFAKKTNENLKKRFFWKTKVFFQIKTFCQISNSHFFLLSKSNHGTKKNKNLAEQI